MANFIRQNGYDVYWTDDKIVARPTKTVNVDSSLNALKEEAKQEDKRNMNLDSRCRITHDYIMKKLVKLRKETFGEVCPDVRALEDMANRIMEKLYQEIAEEEAKKRRV